MNKDIDIEQLKRLHAAATKGEWTIEVEQYGGSGAVTVHGLNRLLHDTEWADPQDFEQDQANAEAIAAIHNAFPALIARLEAAEEAMQSLHNLRTTHVRTADGKLACVEVSRPETHPGTFCMWKLKDFELDSELADAEPGESITLTYCELTEDEFKDLGDFDGW